MIFLEIIEFHGTHDASRKTYLNIEEICSIQEMKVGTRICMNNGKIFEALDSMEDVTTNLKSAMED